MKSLNILHAPVESYPGKKYHRFLFGQWLEKDMLVITLQGTSSRTYTLCFNLLALGLQIVLALENEWEIAIFCYNSWCQLTTHQHSLLKIVLLMLYKSTRFSFHDPCILTLETSSSCHPRFLWMKASWWPFHSLSIIMMTKDLLSKPGCWQWKLALSLIIILGQQVKIVLTKLWCMLPYSFWSLVPSCLQRFRAATWLLPFLNPFILLNSKDYSCHAASHTVNPSPCETETIILLKDTNDSFKYILLLYKRSIL